ncbi:MAG: lycopene cyclase domain-containing protein [Halococcoides sp.]
MIAYWAFLAVAIGLPLAALALVTAHRPPARDRIAATIAMAFVAIGYTAPWDGWLIARGVWQYETAILARVGPIPIEELGFVAGQALLVGLLVWRFDPIETTATVDRRDRVLGAVAGLAVSIVGFAIASRPGGLYLGAILAWAGPVFALQWGVDWRALWARRRTVAWAIGLPTLSLWLVDWVAVTRDLWVFADSSVTGLALWGLPIEEATFFLVTNAFLVQGLVLYAAVRPTD